MKNLKEVQAQYSELYPEKESFSYTEDGNVFLDLSSARDHARKTKQKLQSFGNSKLGKEVHQASDITPQELLATWKEATDYRNDLALAESLGLDLENKKYPTVIAAIEDAKAAMEGGE